jgi:hypothetical protein
VVIIALVDIRLSWLSYRRGLKCLSFHYMLWLVKTKGRPAKRLIEIHRDEVQLLFGKFTVNAHIWRNMYLAHPSNFNIFVYDCSIGLSRSRSCSQNNVATYNADIPRDMHISCFMSYLKTLCSLFPLAQRAIQMFIETGERDIKH